MNSACAVHTPPPRSLLVAGIGSPAAGDDAIGLELVSRLEVVDAAIEVQQWQDADALTLAHNLLEFECPILLVDCADMGLPPGEGRLFRSNEVRLRINGDAISVHGFGLGDALDLVEALGHEMPIWIFGIQPFVVDPALQLTQSMQARLPDLSKTLSQAVNQILLKQETGRAE